MRKLSLVLALIMVFTSIFVPVSVVAAPVQVNANVIINNVPFIPTDPLLNVDDRLLAPFRQIGEAMGASVYWDGNTRRILTLFGNRYSIMHVDNSVITYGTFTRNAQGEVQFAADSRTRILEVAPRLVGNLTYIPVRAFAEIVGGEVNWVAHTSTAFITAVPPQETPGTPETPPTGNRPANFGDFSNTSFFRILSSNAIRNMHQDSNNNPFAFVLYDSSLESSKYIVPNIQDLAQELQFRIYGVDMALATNRAADNNWLWQTFREAQFVDPTIYFVHRRNDVRQIQAPTDMDVLRDRLEMFRTEVETGGIAFGDFSNTPYFRNQSSAFIARQIDDRNEFIVVLYDSTQRDSMHYVPIIKAAAAERQFQVYGLNIDSHPNFHRHIPWLSEFEDYNDLPLMILVYRNRNLMRVYHQPQSVERAVGYIDEFLRNRQGGTTGPGSQFNDIPTGAVFRNESITALRNRYEGRSDSFIIFMYDSSVSTYRAIIESFAERINDGEINIPASIRLYGVNKNSTVFNVNHDRANYDWLGLASHQMTAPRFNSNTPYLILVSNGNLANAVWYPGINQSRTAFQLMQRVDTWLRN